LDVTTVVGGSLIFTEDKEKKIVYYCSMRLLFLRRSSFKNFFWLRKVGISMNSRSWCYIQLMWKSGVVRWKKMWMET